VRVERTYVYIKDERKSIQTTLFERSDGAVRRVAPGGERIEERNILFVVPVPLCTNCARIERFHINRVSVERKAGSPIYWKR
jgi:hypothetical protein